MNDPYVEREYTSDNFVTLYTLESRVLPMSGESILLEPRLGLINPFTKPKYEDLSNFDIFKDPPIEVPVRSFAKTMIVPDEKMLEAPKYVTKTSYIAIEPALEEILESRFKQDVKNLKQDREKLAKEAHNLGCEIIRLESAIGRFMDSSLLKRLLIAVFPTRATDMFPWLN